MIISVFKMKQIISQLFDGIEILDFIFKFKNPRIILGYHRVISRNCDESKFMQNSMYVYNDTFETQIKWMKNIGDIVSLNDILNYNIKTDKPLFSITFDDGWYDNYSNAFPILKKYNIPATIFLASNAINTGEMFWPDELYYKTKKMALKTDLDKIYGYFQTYFKNENVRNTKLDNCINLLIESLKNKSEFDRKTIINGFYDEMSIKKEKVKGHILNWDQIREMMKSKITFGSHTHTHLILKGQNRESILYELKESKRIIESKIETECKYFCYPNARYNTNDHEQLIDTGYSYGFTLDRRAIKKSDSLFYMPRVIVYEDIGRQLSYLKLKLLEFPFY